MVTAVHHLHKPYAVGSILLAARTSSNIKMTDSVVSDPTSGGTRSNGNGENRAADAGSVVSESTQTTQTRFCFYNAEDFVTKSPKQRMQMEGNQINRYSFYNSATASPEPGSHPAKAPSALKSPRASTAPPSLPDAVEDPNEILKSLQAHEQQRRDILQTPSSIKPRSSNGSAVMERASMHSNTSESSNPYEDAIKDALELLRRHRTGINDSKNRPPTVDTSEEGLRGNDEKGSSHVTQEEVDALSRSLDEANLAAEEAAMATPNTASLGEAYQAEIEARRKQRQERMARYANRLAELKQEGTTVNPNSTQILTPSGTTTGDDREEETKPQPPPTSRSAPMMSTAAASGTGGKTNGVESDASSASPEDVQRGVERVLLAILERANSEGRSVRSLSFDEGQADEQNSEEKKTSSAEQVETSDEDFLVKAMSDLLGAPSTSSLGSSSPNRNAIQQWMEAAEREVIEGGSDEESNVTGPLQAAIPEQEPSESQAEDRMVQDELDEMVLKVLSKDKSVTEDSQEDSFDRRVRSILSQEKATQDEDDSEDEEAEDEDVNTSHPDASEEEEHRMSNEEDESIRSNAYTDENTSEGEAFTGEEYTDEDVDDDDDDDDEAFCVHVQEHHGDLDGVLGPLSKKAGGTTGVVLEDDPITERVKSPTILESLSAAMSIVTGRDTSQKPDKYAADYDDDSVADDEDEPESEDDDEARDLMRTLCAHLLPVGVSQSSKLLDKRPAWDESNPDEAGYRIIRLTLPQLKAVERAFDRMVTGLKQNSEKKLSVAGTDEAFERDLRAAEELLDQSEMAPAESKPSTSNDKASQEESELFEFAKEVGEGENLVDFPGVKPTGRGEMGDLEYFHLPIIFKSHVTGFEPTKDMYLEQGNIIAGQYLVEGELGTAAFSTAYRCVDLNSGEGPDDQEEVCLKVIKNTKDFFDQSLDEIKILELLRQTGKCHEKCIVEMKTFFYHREHLIIVTELLRQNLFEFGKFIIDNDEEPYFTISRLAFLTRQVLIALEFVHRLGLVHSDVKPENILLSSYSRAQAKLIDFGSSCYLTDRQSSYIQSRSYRAPEVVLGLPYDGRIDIWSLGCVVAEMFTGEVTFQNDSIVSMLSRIEAICGTFPRHMIAQGRQSGRFFAKSGLLFEKVVDDKDESGHNSDESDDDDSSEPKMQYVDIFQPKTTSLAARLGFAEDLMERYDADVMLTKEESRQAVFVDFIRKLLTIDPDVRPTARQALQHPWMAYAGTLSEDDIKYPSS